METALTQMGNNFPKITSITELVIIKILYRTSLKKNTY